MHVKENSHIEVNQPIEIYSTPLHTACIFNDHATIFELLKHPDIQIAATDKNGSIPLHNVGEYMWENKAAESSIQMLISHQQQKHRVLQLNATNNERQTALHVACLNHHCDAVMELLKYVTVIDINATDRFGKTPLYTACSTYYINTDSVSIVKNLLDQPSIMIHKKKMMIKHHLISFNKDWMTPNSMIKKNV